MIQCNVFQDDCEKFLRKYDGITFDMSFLDPPFNQNKKYNTYQDNLPEETYWKWMTEICRLVFEKTTSGGAIYFMQREKNVHHVILALKNSGWYFQNIVIWKKKTSAVPIRYGFGKHYQVIVFATKEKKPRIFNKLRINPPLLVTEKYERPDGMYVTDVWDDIRELTSGYFAGQEPLRLENGKRLHEQQSPIELLTRLILSSTKPNDMVFDPFVGSGTTLVVAKQLNRNSIGLEMDPLYIKYVNERIKNSRPIDDISKLKQKYKHTKDLDKIWEI
jgi:DNA modification methylase